MHIKPTDSEIEILDLLWQTGPASVRDIHSKLSEKRDLYYTTTLKTMQLMTEKGFLTRDTTQRSHIYHVNIKKEDVEKNLIEKLANSVFKGSAGQLIMSALGHSTPSKDELKEIKALIEKLDQDENP
jgi:predicted transcriptional regulator